MPNDTYALTSLCGVIVTIGSTSAVETTVTPAFVSPTKTCERTDAWRGSIGWTECPVLVSASRTAIRSPVRDVNAVYGNPSAHSKGSMTKRVSEALAT